MASGQVLTALAFEEQVTSTNPKNAQIDYQFKLGENAGEIIVEMFANFADGDRNEHTITVADPVSAAMPDGGYYRVVVSDGTISRQYLHKFSTGQAAADVAASLAPLIDTHPSLQAWQDSTAADTIKVLGKMAGLAITVTVDARDDSNDSAVAGAISSTEDTVATGTGAASRKVAEMKVATTIEYKDATLKTEPTIRLNINGAWYNGSPSSPMMITGGAFGPYTPKHKVQIATLAAAT